ncbi:MAG: hypothetical protein IKD04_05365 [Clostridia bacterium]|nr:hypothetical protein [Clostridia bacterium]
MNRLLTKYISKLRSPKVLVIGGILGILLIFISSLPFGEGQAAKAETANEFSTEQYRLSLQEEITEMVTQITGSKNVTVVITLESGIRYSYADTREEISSDKTEKEAQSSGSELKEGYITVKTADGGEQALLITAEMPEVRGVAIVCEGGDSEIISEKIQNTVTAALNITSKRVYICGRK